jgi:hypothetical protein
MTSYLAKAFKRAAIALICAALSTTAMACLCSNLERSELEASASRYEQVFAGLIIWQSSEPRPVPQVASHDGPITDPGYWVKSKVLVLRVWRGEPPVVAEVWTTVVTSCDSWPLPGYWFVALTKNEAGRNVAENSECGGPLRDYATAGPAAIAWAGLATLAAILGLAFLAVVRLMKVFQRRRAPAGRG